MRQGCQLAWGREEETEGRGERSRWLSTAVFACTVVRTSERVTCVQGSRSGVRLSLEFTV